MLRVLGITKAGNAIVDTEGLYRVIIHPGEEIVEELLNAEEAAGYADAYNGCVTGRRAEVIGYSAHCASS